MKSTQFLISLVAALAFALMIANVSAFGQFDSVEVKGQEVLNNGVSIAAFAGETIPVRVTFTADAGIDDVEDARVKVWITGAAGYTVSSERFDVVAGSTYSRLVSVNVPFDLDADDEDLSLLVSVESDNDGRIDEVEIPLAGQRESYVVEVLDVNVDSQVTAGETIPVDIVLKNRGRHFAEDTFVRVRIPALGLEESAYFGDLSPKDQDSPDKEDAVERRLFLSIPSSAKAGIYVVELEAYNDDSVTTVSKKIAVVGAGENSMVVAPVRSKTLAVGEKAMYKITLVNSGNKVRVYELSAESPDGLNVELEDPVVVVPAGSSKTVVIDATAQKTGTHSFTVSISSDGNLVKTEDFTANVEGTRARSAAGNTTVLLTVVLAIIFVVLLVVLIVLLTRKPEKQKEFGESYY